MKLGVKNDDFWFRKTDIGASGWEKQMTED